MIRNLENDKNYKQFVCNILKRVPLMKTKQMIICIKKYYRNDEKITDAIALEILLGLQRQGEIYLSEDGWVMTKGMYWRATDDRYRKSIMYSEIYKLPAIDKVCSNINKELVSSMWIVANNMPDSNDFALACSPWTIVFTKSETSNEPSCLYEIIYIPRSKQDAMIHMLRALPKYQSNDFRKTVKRIAIIESSAIAWRIPYLGISEIYHLKDGECELIEKRNDEEIWKDYRE